jgi:hypothetical protein
MASYRKKYTEQAADSPAPPAAAEPAPPVAETKPPEPVEIERNPADAAASSAIKQRLQEMEAAQAHTQEHARQQREAIQQQQPPQPEMPEAVRQWLSEHPQYCDPNDVIAQHEIQLASMKCARDGLTWERPEFIPTIERHLGLRQEPPPVTNGNGHAPSEPVNFVSPPPQRQPAPQRQGPPVRQQAPVRPSVMVSAPPTRETVSMTTGRPTGGPVKLTQEEFDLAHSLGISPQEYEKQKRKMLAMKAAGQIQDGR